MQHVDHHLVHAASAYLTSGWDECLVVVFDGMGEAHGASIYHARDGRLEALHRISAGNSIGIFFSVVTLHLGFEFNADEYKIMGLAPYGQSERFRAFFDSAIVLRDDGGWGDTSSAPEPARAGRARELPGHETLPVRSAAPPRDPEGDIGRVHEDVAASLQASLDCAILHLTGHFAARTGLRRVAMAGGVALNTTANGRLLESGVVDEIYVQPAAADDGAGLGAALQRAALVGEIANRRSPTPFYGPAHPDAAIAQALHDFSDAVDPRPLVDLWRRAPWPPT